jgi:SAM-dependent methyltransferase
MTVSEWVTEHTPQDRPNSARIYDYLLGGYHNFETDRLAAEKYIAALPDARLGAQAGRAFLRRVVHFCLDQGVDQFLDLGSGIPTVGNVHEIAQQANPAARVVYVDIDPIAVAHSLAILRDNPNAAAIQADIAQPEQVLNHAEVKRLLDFRRPAAVLLLSVLHFVTDDDQAYRAVRVFRDALTGGGYVAIVHFTFDDAPLDMIERFKKVMVKPNVSKARTYAETARFFDGLELVAPGLVHVPLWRPEGPDDVFLTQPERVVGWAGVGRRP